MGLDYFRYNTIGHQFSRFGHQRFFGLAPKFTNGHQNLRMGTKIYEWAPTSRHQKLSFRAPKNIVFGTKILESGSYHFFLNWAPIF
jgi:hypothetical protein